MFNFGTIRKLVETIQKIVHNKLNIMCKIKLIPERIYIFYNYKLQIMVKP